MGSPNIEKMERDKDVEGLIEALRHEGVRLEAVMALARMGKPAVEPLIQSLKNEDRSARFSAAVALGKIGDPRAIEPLIRALRDEAWNVRIAVATALGEIGDERAVEPLTQALNDDNEDVRMGAKKALEKIKTRVKSPPQAEKCPSCGVDVPVGAEFCPNCGRRVK